jgi:hypothetical protein
MGEWMQNNGKTHSSTDTGRVSNCAWSQDRLGSTRRRPSNDAASLPGCSHSERGVGARRRGVRTRDPIMTRSEARRGPRMRIPGRLGDREGADWRRTRPSELDPTDWKQEDVYPECWPGTYRSDNEGDTQCASGHHMCDLCICMCRYDHAEVVLTLC